MKRLILAVVLASSGSAAAEDDPPPPSHEGTHEIIYTRPSGFWTSNRPAEGGAYRYRLLGIGVAIVGIMGFVMIRLIRKANTAPRARLVKTSE